MSADLVRIREELGLSQEQAGRRVGYGQSAWSRWESGADVPPLVAWCLAVPAVRHALLVEKALLLGVDNPVENLETYRHDGALGPSGGEP